MLKSLLVIAFIGGVGALALYAAQRPTVARGDVMGADIVAANPAALRAMECDHAIEIGVDGAHFWCMAEFKDGAIRRLKFWMDRAGLIHNEEGEDRAPAPLEHSSDPWD